jgi:uncharacterized protein (TIGR03000 family)
MKRLVTKVLTAGAVLAVLGLWVGVRPVQAKEWPGPYDFAGGQWYADEEREYQSIRGDSYRPFYAVSPGRAVYVPSYPYAMYSPTNSYYEPAYGASVVPSYSYGAYGPAAPMQDNMARIRVVVPDGARVWFDNQPTKQTGSVRNFESPALKPGHEYTYDVKAQWRDQNGKEVTRTRHIDVRANGSVTVDFNRQ